MTSRSIRVLILIAAAVAAGIATRARGAAPGAGEDPSPGDSSAIAEAPDLQEAFARLDRFAEKQMRQDGIPGMAVALTDRQGLLRVETYGFADLRARTRLRPEHLFEIGSISKSFTAIALLQDMEKGRFDPQAPIARYLPWFKVRTRYAPITGHHLLTHTAGLPDGHDDVPSSLYQVVVVREVSAGYAPGRHYSYSNIGFQILGAALEEIDGTPYPEIIRERILAPLGMKESEPAITHETRRRLAVGYEPFYDDRPAGPDHPLAEATWLEYGAGDGSIAATPADLAAYLRMLLNRGAGPHGRILSEESFRLMTRPAIPAGDGESYGYGLVVQPVGGHTLVHHTGGMVGYHSMILGDLDDGVGIVVLINAPGRKEKVAEYGLNLMHAALHGQPLPPVPDPPPATRVSNAADYAGTYRAPDGRSIAIEAEGDGLVLLRAGQRVPLEARDRDWFYAGHPDFTLYLLHFGRDADGRVVEALHGPDWYANERYRGPRAFDVPRAWLAYPGHYRTSNPWLSNFRVVLRKGRLWMIDPDGEENALAPAGRPGFFRMGDGELTPETLELDSAIRGRTQRALLSGVAYYRTFTP